MSTLILKQHQFVIRLHDEETANFFECTRTIMNKNHVPVTSDIINRGRGRYSVQKSCKE